MQNRERENSLPISENEQKDVEQIFAQLRAAEAKLIGPDGRTKNLPPNVNAFLYQLLADLVAGKSVTILQNDAALTTVEAAKMLGMSRQFLIQLLEQGEIPFFMVGTHRRIYVRNVMSYKDRRDASRRKMLDDLARSEKDADIYDKVPINDPDSGQ
jgi:excisionase family DNA binding protein